MRMRWTMLLAGLVLSVSANAALTTNPSGTEGSSLFLTVYNGVDKSIVVDLGVDANATDFSTFTFSSSFASQLTTAFGGVATSFLYSVVAVSTDALNTGIWTTHTSPSVLPYPTLSNGTTISTKLNAYVAGNNPSITGTGLGSSNASAPVTAGNSAGFYTGQNFNGDLGGTFPANMGDNVGDSMYFYSLLSKDFDSTLDNTFYGTGRKWLLNAAGLLTYGPTGGAPVPLPAAIYMLGAALMGLVGIGRRRSVATA